jgi:DNA-binding transcriptional LysR family regulator
MSESSGQLPYLDTFSRAAELSSFTAAGKSLGMTQAAVSQRIHTLESELGIALFDRRGGRVFLTDAGQRLYTHAQQILDLHRKARQEVTGKKTPISGDLLVAASSIPGEHLLPAILSIFRRQHPDVRVRVKVTDSVNVMGQVEKGQVHVGLVGRQIENSKLEFKDFATDEMVVIAPPNHRWRKSKRIPFKRFRKEPLILRETGSGSRWCFEQALTRSGHSFDELEIALELGSNEAIKEAVLRGMGVSVLSTHAVRKELKAKQLHGIKVTELVLERKLFIATDKRRVLPAPARIFLHFLKGCPGAGPRS